MYYILSSPIGSQLSITKEASFLIIGIKSSRSSGWIPSFMGLFKKIIKIFKILIFYIKKLRKNSCEYRLYIL